MLLCELIYVKLLVDTNFNDTSKISLVWLGWSFKDCHESQGEIFMNDGPHLVSQQRGLTVGNDSDT